MQGVPNNKGLTVKTLTCKDEGNTVPSLIEGVTTNIVVLR